jgi:hypothetical protein
MRVEAEAAATDSRGSRGQISGALSHARWNSIRVPLGQPLHALQARTEELKRRGGLMRCYQVQAWTTPLKEFGLTHDAAVLAS